MTEKNTYAETLTDRDLGLVFAQIDRDLKALTETHAAKRGRHHKQASWTARTWARFQELQKRHSEFLAEKNKRHDAKHPRNPANFKD